jgi:hypothetical protein
VSDAEEDYGWGDDDPFERQRYEEEQALLAADPEYADWLDSINAWNRRTTEDFNA